MSDAVLYDVDNGVASISLNRPEAANSLSPDVVSALRDALETAELDTSVGAIVLSGEGRGFCGGGNTKAMPGVRPEDKVRSITKMARFVEVFVTIQTPVVVAVHGYCVGAGVSLAFASDVIVADEDTRFRMAFRDIGLLPDMGAHHFLAQAVGVWRAKQMIWSGASFTAADAQGWGVVAQVTAPGEARKVATEIATDLAAGPRHAIAYTKTVLAQAHLDQLRAVLNTEGYASSVLRSTADHAEGLAAQREKRPPVFGQG